MDLFVVPTLAFNLLYGFIIVRLDRRELVWIAVTNSPTAEWIARQITEAFPWESAPGYLSLLYWGGSLSSGSLSSAFRFLHRSSCVYRKPHPVEGERIAYRGRRRGTPSPKQERQNS